MAKRGWARRSGHKSLAQPCQGADGPATVSPSHALLPGYSKNKLRDFNCRPGAASPAIEQVRAQMATFINEALEDAGSKLLVSHLSYEALGIDKTPTTHLGPAAWEMERRQPGSSDRGNRNRAIETQNQAMDELVAELAALDAEIAELEEQRLDARYGLAEPDDAPAWPADAEPLPPVEATIQQAVDRLSAGPEANEMPLLPTEVSAASDQPPRSVDAVIRSALDTLNLRSEAAGLPPPSDTASSPAARQTVAAAIRPAIASLHATGETSPGSRRRWKKMIDAYRRGMDRFADRVADVGREVRGSWQRLVGRRADRERHGPER